MKTNCCSLFGRSDPLNDSHRIFLSTIYLRRPRAEKTIVDAEKKINRISLCCKTIKIQISSFAGFASICQAPTELPRQAGEWRMLFEVLPSTLASPNDQFAPSASQHHLWFSEVQKDGRPLTIWSSWSQVVVPW